MTDAKPVLVVLVLSGCALLWLALEWSRGGQTLRPQRLAAIARLEDAPTWPPAKGFMHQARWLLTHRWVRVQGLGVLCGLCALIGLCEGWAWRQRDRYAGFRFGWWTSGLLGLALVPGLVGFALLSLWPWSTLLASSVGASWSALTCFLLSRGRPYVP